MKNDIMSINVWFPAAILKLAAILDFFIVAPPLELIVRSSGTPIPKMVLVSAV